MLESHSDTFKKRVQVHTMRPRNMTHVRASELNYHPYHKLHRPENQTEEHDYWTLGRLAERDQWFPVWEVFKFALTRRVTLARVA